MKTITRNIFPSAACAAFTLLGGCAGPINAQDDDPRRVHAGRILIEADDDRPKPPFTFSVDDEALLHEIGHATFGYFWHTVNPRTGMVPDRTGGDVISAAGVGFQLATLPIGVERGWVSRDEARARAHTILRSLADEPTNRKSGLFYHFLNPDDATPRRIGAEMTVSTIDSALLFSGMLCAGAYFGGEVAEIADRLYAQADWSFFFGTPGVDDPPGQFVSLGWKPTDDADPTGDGTLIPYYWVDCGDEHRLVTLLAVGAPNPAHRAEASMYWSLRRQLGWHEGQGHLVWLPYSGSLFTAFFAHCFVNYAALGPDDPSRAGVAHRAGVDWWENSRRTVHLHRDLAIANPLGLPTLGPDAWGLSACDGPSGYIVPGLFPEPVEMIGAAEHRDYPAYRPEQKWGGGVVPPYAAGASIMFEPTLAVRALRHYRDLKDASGAPGVWRGGGPAGPGFADAFTLDAAGTVNWAASDLLSIDQGPLLLGIENARSGLVWNLFMGHPVIEAALSRLGPGMVAD